ncbi:hypothetical protein UZ38_30025, partial [Bacillus amyloliquefaciens]
MRSLSKIEISGKCSEDLKNSLYVIGGDDIRENGNGRGEGGLNHENREQYTLKRTMKSRHLFM